VAVPVSARPGQRTDRRGIAAGLAQVLKALGDPVRLRLVSLIGAREGGEVCGCDLTSAFDLSQPTISHHLTVLREAGLIDSERRGTLADYRLVPRALERMAAVLSPPARCADRRTYRAALAVSKGRGGRHQRAADLEPQPACAPGHGGQAPMATGSWLSQMRSPPRCRAPTCAVTAHPMITRWISDLPDPQPCRLAPVGFR